MNYLCLLNALMTCKVPVHSVDLNILYEIDLEE